MDRVVTPEQVIQYFSRQGRQVLTFTGFSGAGYQDPSAMLEQARQVLEGHDPATTIVNIGATSSGIGAVYELAQRMGFATTGIVSSQALEHGAEISPHVDTFFYIGDETWGGYLPGSEALSPTSRAMVEVSDVMVSIGGGEVSRDELMAARRQGKETLFIPAEMNHAQAIEKARKQGLPPPTDFKGPAHQVFGRSG